MSNNYDNYIELEFDLARIRKWDRGRTARRLKNGVMAERFVGDPVEEAFKECCDLFNYLEEAERQTGRSYALCRAQVRQIAAKLQQRWHVARRAAAKGKEASNVDL